LAWFDKGALHEVPGSVATILVRPAPFPGSKDPKNEPGQLRYPGRKKRDQCQFGCQFVLQFSASYCRANALGPVG